MKMNPIIASLALMPLVAAAAVQPHQDEYGKVEARAVAASEIEALNRIYSQIELPGISQKLDVAQYSQEMRTINNALLAATLADYYALGAKHSFVLANSGSQYSNYYSFAHHYQGMPVANEIITLVLDENNNIRELLGTLDVKNTALLPQKKKGMKVLAGAAEPGSKESVTSWLSNNERSPFYGYQITVNAIRPVLDKDTFGEPVYAHKVDVFFVDEKGEPNRVLLVLDSETKEIYRQRDLLKLAHVMDAAPQADKADTGQPSIQADEIKRLNAYGSNFFAGRREYQSPYAPKLTNCKFYSYETDGDKDRRTIITVDMLGEVSYDNWDAYQLSTSDCDNTSTFYEASQLGLTYAYSPLADAHLHAELVTQMYQELSLGAILGTCKERPDRQENCQELYGRYYGSSDVGSDVPIYQGVHYGINHVGAFWSGRAAYYGDGGFGILPNVSLDIVAHELTHGFEEMTTDDIYMRALDETISDIAGEAAKENIYNKTKDMANPYFASDASYLNDYRHKFGGEAIREADVAIRLLLSPAITSIPETVTVMDQHELSGPLTKVFATLVNDNKFSSYSEAFNILAQSKMSCVHEGLNGYEGLRQAVSCIIDIAKNIKPATGIEASLVDEFNKVNLKLDCLENSLCGVENAGIQQQVNGDNTSYTYGLINNSLGLSTNWTIRSDGQDLHQSSEAQITISQGDMDNFGDSYEVEVKITSVQGEPIEEITISKVYTQSTPTTYCRASGILDNEGNPTTEVYISELSVQGVVFQSESDGFRYDPSRVVTLNSQDGVSEFPVSVTLGAATDPDWSAYYITFWLDADADGQFVEPGGADTERLMLTSIRYNGSASNYSFNFDNSKMTKASRLRVVLSKNYLDVDKVCTEVGSDVEGEVEDVGINLASNSQ